MKYIRAFVLLLLVSTIAGFTMPRQVAADAADEAALAVVEEEVGALWNFVDASSRVDDSVFYPQFVARADDVQAKLETVQKQLAQTKETGRTKEAVDRLREDVQQIQVGVIAWRESAAANDSAGFEEASYFLQQVLEIYNEDVDAYDDAAYSSRALAVVLMHTAPAFVGFALCGLLFAWAIARNTVTQDPVMEILRKLRWHMAIAMVVPVAIGILIAYLFYFTTLASLLWAWVLYVVGCVAVLYIIIRYIRVKRLMRS